MKRQLRNIGQFLMVILFMYYYIVNVSFIHTHIFRYYTVTHSHPYASGSQHSHSAEELETIALFNAFVVLASPLLVVACRSLLIGFVSSVYKLTHARGYHCFQLLRAPPAY